jgi:predicted GNAT family N-acyltransferase
MRIGEPETPEQFEEYFDLRWRVLRAPWEQPRGSERDDREEVARHVTARDQTGELLGVGRLHMNDQSEAQIRYMATEERWRGRGIGRAVAQELENRARRLGAERVVLDARLEYVEFYRALGYSLVGPGPTKYGTLEHRRMEKRLQGSGTRED